MNYPLCIDGQELFLFVSYFVCYNNSSVQPVISRQWDGMQNVTIGIATNFRNGKPLRFVFLGSLRPSADRTAKTEKEG
jgi:hypothetical protein